MEEFSTTPYTNWDDVGGLQLLKLELERRIIKLIKFPQVYEVAPFPLCRAILYFKAFNYCEHYHHIVKHI